jgi:hypothetical protein
VYGTEAKLSDNTYPQSKGRGASQRSIAAWNPIKNLLIPYSSQTNLPMQCRPSTAHLHLHGRARFAPFLRDAFALGEPVHFNYPLSVKYDSEPGRAVSMLSSILFVEQRYSAGKGDEFLDRLGGLLKPKKTRGRKRNLQEVEYIAAQKIYQLKQ